LTQAARRPQNALVRARLVWLVALTCLAGTAAAAAPFGATFGLQIAPSGVLAFPSTGSGSSTALGVTLPGGVVAGSGSFPVTGLLGLSRIAVRVLGNASGSFAGTPLAGPMRLAGFLALKGSLGAGPQTWAAVPLFTSHLPGSGAEAVGLGVGGSYFKTFQGRPSLYLNVFHTDWSVGPKTVTGVSNPVSYHVPSGPLVSMALVVTYTNGTAMYTGSDSRTPGGLGQVTLVSPTKVRTTVPVGAGLRIYVLAATLTLHFVPEPGTALLLGLGVAVLGALGRRTARGRSRG
jgi:hypothetical protein